MNHARRKMLSEAFAKFGIFFILKNQNLSFGVVFRKAEMILRFRSHTRETGYKVRVKAGNISLKLNYKIIISFSLKF